MMLMLCSCVRLGLVSLAYLWHRDQDQLLADMVKDGLDAVLIKVTAMGKEYHVTVMFTLRGCWPTLSSCMSVLLREDCKTVVHSADAFAPVAYLHLTN